jgi:hypothetical protein
VCHAFEIYMALIGTSRIPFEGKVDAFALLKHAVSTNRLLILDDPTPH